MNLAERLDQINKLLPALQSSALVAHLSETIAEQTASLISSNDEQVRGRIKALRDLLNLPEALQHERQSITAALSDEDAANN